jgi:hypothetical protein
VLGSDRALGDQAQDDGESAADVTCQKQNSREELSAEVDWKVPGWSVHIRRNAHPARGNRSAKRLRRRHERDGRVGTVIPPPLCTDDDAVALKPSRSARLWLRDADRDDRLLGPVDPFCVCPGRDMRSAGVTPRREISAVPAGPAISTTLLGQSSPCACPPPDGTADLRNIPPAVRLGDRAVRLVWRL